MSTSKGFRRTATRLAVPAALGFAILVATPARADFTSFDGAFSFAVLGQFSNNQTNFNNGTLNGAGNRVFNVTSVNFPNGTFTINGSASDFVVLNNVGGGNWHGQIVLSGG